MAIAARKRAAGLVIVATPKECRPGARPIRCVL